MSEYEGEYSERKKKTHKTRHPLLRAPVADVHVLCRRLEEELHRLPVLAQRLDDAEPARLIAREQAFATSLFRLVYIYIYKAKIHVIFSFLFHKEIERDKRA